VGGKGNGMTVVNYRDLLAWQKAMDLVETIYDVTRTFPHEELYALSSQLRRAAISIPSNIAEGQGRRSTKELLHHRSIAHGSLREVETQILIAQRLDYLSEMKVASLIELTSQVGRLINGLANALARR
jgi:four helix bundle protein